MRHLLPDRHSAHAAHALREARNKEFERRDAALPYQLADLDEVGVRVPQVHGADLGRSACAHDRALDDGDLETVEMGDDVVQRAVCDEAQIEAPWRRELGLGLKLLALLVQVDLLVAEPERDAAVGFAKCLELHAQHLHVEADALVLVLRGEHEVVKVRDHPFS